MTYFSRLTDIVTCNLADLLRREADPASAVRQIIREMEEGVTGARRSAAAAASNEARLGAEMDEHRTRTAFWTAKAREELAAGQEDQARMALVRKRELEDLIAALQQQQAAAAATREHLATTLRALEVRLSDARRKQQELEQAASLTQTSQISGANTPPTVGARRADLDDTLDVARNAQIEAELEALKRELEEGN